MLTDPDPRSQYRYLPDLNPDPMDSGIDPNPDPEDSGLGSRPDPETGYRESQDPDPKD